MKRFKKLILVTIVSLLAFTIVLFDWKFSYSSHSLVRTDTIVYEANFTICLSADHGNVSADYSAGRYVTFPDRSSNSFRIDSSEYPGGALCSTATEVIVTTELPGTLPTGSTIKLWTSDPNANHDTTPPTISNLTASSITQTGATITWTTNESATHTIKYGTTSGSYDSYANTKAAGSGTSASGVL